MITVPFPPGEILDRDGFVWVTLPPGAAITRSRIFGTCSDPFALCIAQMTIERGDWRLDLFSFGQEMDFPFAGSVPIAIPGMEQHDVRAWSTTDEPVKVTVHVRRDHGARRDERGRIDALPDPVKFHLVLLVRSAEEMSA